MKGSSLLPPLARRLEGKVAIITGGASGIGESAARLFAKHGAKVVIADIQEKLGRSVCNDIGFEHDEEDVVSYVHCDVTNEADVEKTVNTVIDKYGKLDIMLSNAGNGGTIDTSRLISMVDYNHYKRVFDVNVFGAFAAAKHAARVMIPARVGSILFTSSAASSVTYGNSNHHQYPYLESTDVVAGLAKNLGMELGQYGIRVNCISPFALASPLLLLRSLAGIDKLGKLGETLISKGEVLEAKDMAHAEPIWW